MPHSPSALDYPYNASNAAPAVRLDDRPNWIPTPDWGPPQIQNWAWNMSQQSENNQASSYYTQAQFPSPSLSGQYSYPPPEGQGNSPSGANMENQPSLSLPPIRIIDGQPQQQQPQQQRPSQPGAPSQMGSAIPSGMAQYYPQGQPFPTTSDPNAPMRYPIPPDGRVMSGGRHKKEIKRRTKTGCLTCRKRRIKCDEAHPACRNCQKSKRECLGYDPIFKSQPGPSNIQPALGGAPQPTSSNSSPYPPPPQGYIPAGTQGYGQAGTDSENAPAQPYDYSAAIDPSLDGGASQVDSRSILGTGTPYPTMAGADQHSHRAKRTKIEELLCLRGVPPPPPAPPAAIPEGTRNEIKDIFLTIYAVQIDKFLETRWFAQRAVDYLMSNSRLCDQFATLISRYHVNTQDPNYWNHLMMTQSLEATVIWAMMGMCRQVSSCAKSGEGDEQERENLEKDVRQGVHDAAKRLEIFDNLITGEYLDSDSAPQPTPQQPSGESNGAPFNEQLIEREHDFWRHVHKFITIRDDEASSAKEIDDTLASARNLLDSRENRDVIYSICIARHVGARMAEYAQQPQSNDEEESRNKLFIAKKFIDDEAAGKGTNQVVQRLCGMASRSWEFNRPVMQR